MLISVKIIKSMESEGKKQKALLKTLETQEKDYGVNLTQQKQDIKNSIAYYEKTIKEAA